MTQNIPEPTVEELANAPVRVPNPSPEVGEAQELPRPISLLINANSRTGREMFPRAVELIKAAGIPLAEAVAAKNKDESFNLLRREIKAKANLIIVGGGDGSLSLCAQELAGSETAMGVLPMGTGNTLARSLGIPVDLEGAVKTIAEGRIEAIDVGRCNKQLFLNSVTLGLSAEIASALTKEIKQKMGLMAWPAVTSKVFYQHRPLVLKITSPDKTYRVRTHQLVIANGRYVAGPVAVDPNASIQSKELDVFVLGDGTKQQLLKTAWKWVRGELKTTPEARFFSTTELKVESLRGKVKADVDGEINDGTPLELSVWPRALRVVVPHNFDADKA